MDKQYLPGYHDSFALHLERRTSTPERNVPYELELRSKLAYIILEKKC